MLYVYVYLELFKSQDLFGNLSFSDVLLFDLFKPVCWILDMYMHTHIVLLVSNRTYI